MPASVEPTPADSRNRVRLHRFKFNGGAQALAHYIKRKLKLIHGGRGSGKSVLHYLHYVDQANDTDQIHALFTNTLTQLTNGILPQMQARLLRVGIGLEYDREPPIEWFRDWERKGIKIPPLTKYRGVTTLSTGVHVVCGTLHNQSFRQFQSIDFRTVRIDEVFNCTLTAVRTIIACCRCGGADDQDIDLELDQLYDWLENPDRFELFARAQDGARGSGDSDDEDSGDCGHLHEVVLSGNPPLGPHWIFDWLDQREGAAKKFYVGTAAVDHRNWDLLRAGVGRMIMIRSSTRENLKNIGREYLEGLEDDYSSDVAARLIDGEIVREAAGRAFTQYTSANVSEVPYDPDRDIYVWLDFDLRPRAAVFAYQLKKGEYPDQGPRDNGVTHLGIFGEFFSEMPMSNRDFIEALVKGGRGSGGDCQYEDAHLRGLPENWNGLRGHRGRLLFSGDAQGKDKSRHADDLASDWLQVRQVLDTLFSDDEEQRYIIQVPKRNPEPSTGIHALQGKFCAFSNIRAVHIDPIARHLIRDAETCEWDDKGHDLKHFGAGFGGGTQWMRTHLIKALIYGVYPLSPLGRDIDPSEDIPTGKLPRRIKPPSFFH